MQYIKNMNTMLRNRVKWHSRWSLIMCVTFMAFMIFSVFLSVGCSSKDDIPGSPNDGSQTPGGGQTPISLPDLTCPTGTARLAGASKKTTDTCMLDTDGDGTPDSIDDDDDNDDIPDLTDIDDDGDGLMEIDSLVMLHNIRHNPAGTSYKIATDGANDAGDTTGCGKTGSVVCDGYELTQDLSFDKGGYDGTWRGDSSSGYTLDPDDSASPYFIVDGVGDDGWLPIDSFNAIFEGNGHTITGLAIHRNEEFIGMFGVTGSNAEIRNIGLKNNLANCTRMSRSHIGGLVGQLKGSITGSYATGSVNGGAGGDYIGGLVGWQNDESITASYARGKVDGGAGNDFAGGLVGWQDDGIITASYATGSVNGGSNTGGLVGYQNAGSIIASYATGDVDGGALRGGSLVGYYNSGSIIASYGFGMPSGGSLESFGAHPKDANNDAISAEELTLSTSIVDPADSTMTIIGSLWNDATKNTLGAWDFGTTSQIPALKYFDYDGSGDKYYCDNVIPPTTGTPIPIANCGDFIPGQR